MRHRSLTTRGARARRLTGEDRLLPVGDDRVRDRVDARVRDVDGPHAEALACARVHGRRGDDLCDMYIGVEQPYGAQVLRVLCVRTSRVHSGTTDMV